MNSQEEQKKVPGFICVDVVLTWKSGECYETKYVNPRCIAEFGHQYILIDQAHCLSVRQSLGDIVRLIEKAYEEQAPHPTAKGGLG